MVRGDVITFREGCDKYLDSCRDRNLKEGTVNHYRQSYTQFYKYFNPDILKIFFKFEGSKTDMLS